MKMPGKPCSNERLELEFQKTMASMKKYVEELNAESKRIRSKNTYKQATRTSQVS